MKQALFLFFLIFSTYSFSQNWKELKVDEGVKIEFSVQENHDNSKDIHQEYIVLKLTNLDSQEKEIDVNITFDYGYGNSSDSESNNLFTISPNSSITGDISSNTLVIFKRFLNNISNTNLINFDVDLQINN